MLRTAARQRGIRVLLLLALVSFFVGGCSPDAFLVTDEDRERNFLRAKDAERLRDYEAAAEFYERALEKNPRSSVAHLGYAALCEAQLRRYAEAVYHYQRYLRLKPEDPKAESIRSRVTNCTERLATSVPLVIRSETIARDLEAVRRENLSLRSEVTNLLAFSTTWSNEVRRLSAALAGVTASGGPATAQSAAPSGAGGQGAVSPKTRTAASPRSAAASRSATPGGSSVAGGATTAGGSRPGTSYSTSSNYRSPASSASGMSSRAHRVISGDTMGRIARQYGVSLEGLRRANPGLDERRLRPGMYVRIPGR
ncbi:MAG: tetratricopeptide repeat protein [Verrucomicrobiales bacterium]|nr:tetratricopeptide repeat protein [Verrucomicrobiales bacterium]